MRKIIFRIFLVFIGILISFLIFISTIGIKTDKLNSQIINQIKVFDENLNLELKKVNIIFDPIKLRINLKTIGTNLIYKEKEIQLASIQSTISVKSFFKNQFSLTNLKISTKSIEIKNLLSFFRLFKNDAKIYLVEKLILKGDILGNIYVEFDNKGRIKDNFKIDGFVKNGRINTLRKYQLDKMNFRFNIVKNNINFNEISIYLNDNNLFSPELIVQKKKNKFFIKGKAYSKKISLNEKQIKDYIYLDNSYLAIKNVDFKINNEFSFEINQKYKIRNFTNNFIIDLDNLIVNSQYDYTNFFPKSQKKIEFQKHKLFVSYKKDMLDIKGSGDVLFQENNDKIKYSIKKTNKEIDFDIKLNILKNQLNLDLLNYKKEGDTNLEINLIGTKVFDGITVIEKALIKEKSNIFKIEKLIFNNDNKISKFNKLELNYIDSESIENQFSILKKK